MLHSDRSDTNGGAASAEAASLKWCSDEEPGIRRLRRGKRFDYRNAKGERIDDARTLDRIRKLVIPPAWTDVWIAPYATCHIQATGRDQRGRKQYRYHERWTATRDEVKFSTLLDFAKSLPRLRAGVDADLRKRGVGRDKVLATIVWLLDNAMIRIGNAAYAKENKSFGLTTLRNRHADINGSSMRLSFKGKSGKDWNLRIADRRIVRIVKLIQELPGQLLFQYLDDDGQRCAVTSGDVNDYIRERSGNAFTSKHFRTWGGTVMAAALFAGTDLPESQAGRRRTSNGLVDQVAKHLGNTRAVCRKGYIHPAIIESWEKDALKQEVGTARKRLSRTPKLLDRGEAVVMKWLEGRAEPA